MSLKVIFLLFISVWEAVCTGDWNKQIEYFERTTLQCSGGDADKVVQFVHFWVLPSGELRRPRDHGNSDSHIVLKDNGFVLEIDRVDDADFGTYLCVVSLGRNDTDAYKVGINVDGPYYGPEYYDSIKSNAIVGGTAAGVVLVILVGVWLLCTNCKRKSLKETSDELTTTNETFDEENDVKTQINGHVEVGTTKLQDSVYYIADSVIIQPVAVQTVEKRTTPLPENSHVDRLSTTDSGHYQSIGSLGRDMHLPDEAELDKITVDSRQEKSVDPGDIYTRYVASVHLDQIEVINETTSGHADDVFETESESNGNSVRYASGTHSPALDESEPSITDTNETKHTDVTELYSTPLKRVSENAETGPYDNIAFEADEETPVTRGVIQSVTEVESTPGNDIHGAPDMENLLHKDDTEPDVSESHQSTLSTPTEDKEMNADGTVTPTNSAITPASRGESTASSSEVDDETIMNFNNVLSSLAGAKLKKKSDASSDVASQGSDTEGSEKSVEDVRL